MPTESYEDLAVTNGTTYYYRVRTVDVEGYASVYSAIVSATPNPAGETASRRASRHR